MLGQAGQLGPRTPTLAHALLPLHAHTPCTLTSHAPSHTCSSLHMRARPAHSLHTHPHTRAPLSARTFALHAHFTRTLAHVLLSPHACMHCTLTSHAPSHTHSSLCMHTCPAYSLHTHLTQTLLPPHAHTPFMLPSHAPLNTLSLRTHALHAHLRHTLTLAHSLCIHTLTHVHSSLHTHTHIHTLCMLTSHTYTPSHTWILLPLHTHSPCMLTFAHTSTLIPPYTLAHILPETNSSSHRHTHRHLSFHKHTHTCTHPSHIPCTHTLYLHKHMLTFAYPPLHTHPFTNTHSPLHMYTHPYCLAHSALHTQTLISRNTLSPLNTC